MTDDGRPATDKSQGRQFYINTGHARQRQALYFNENKQVDALYGINVAKIDFNNQNKPHDIHISVPALVCCGQGEGEGVALCKPDCLPARPGSSPGTPLSDKYQTINCGAPKNTSPNAVTINNNTIAYSSRPRTNDTGLRTTRNQRRNRIESSRTRSNLVNRDSSRTRSNLVNRVPDNFISSEDITPATSDPITFDPSTRFTTTEPTTTLLPTTSLLPETATPSEVSSALHSLGSERPSASYFHNQAAGDYPDAQTGAAMEAEIGYEEQKTDPFYMWPLMIVLYLLAWFGLIVYMCISCLSHSSIVLANVVLLVLFWCDSHCYHLCPQGQS